MDYKYYIVLVILFILVKSSPFVSLLSKIEGTVKTSGELTGYGVILQSIFFILVFIGIESLINGGYL